jgi:hydroxypyruvate reductase
MQDTPALLRALFDTAVSAAMPATCMAGALPARPAGNVIVVGAGKAGASMAAEVERQWPAPLDGIVIVPYGHGADCQHIEIVEAAHPVPDAAGVAAARQLLDRVSGLAADDTVVCLFSGGGSSLLTLPREWLTLDEKQAITRALLKSGASIQEINQVRKHLSSIKGGKLAAACAPARVTTFVISDVPGNDLSVVASGPTIPDTTTGRDALAVLDSFHIKVSETVREQLAVQTSPQLANEQPPVLLATADVALEAAASEAGHAGFEAMNLGDLAGDARKLAVEHAGLALERANSGRPCIIISGGETTVNVTGSGRGGRNGEYALALAIALDGHSGISAIACDTDGIDGAGDNAGYIVTPDTLSRASAVPVDALTMQANNDSYGFFDALGDLVITGPTRTNVNDFRAIVVR